jgi:flagellar assembly factor FliW
MSIAMLSKTTKTVQMPVICLAAPMPGFPDDRHFVLRQLDESGLLYEMESLETPGLRFLVVPPAPFFPDYSPEVDDETLGLLKTGSADNLSMLLVVTVGDSVRDSTVNLMAPIVIDQETRRGAQLVIANPTLGTRERLGKD